MAVGSWIVRGKNAPSIGKDGLQPIDEVAEAEEKARNIRQRHVQANVARRYSNSDENPLLAGFMLVGSVAESANAWWMTRQARQQPGWNVSRAGRAGELLLESVASYCLGCRWAGLAESSLVTLVPELAGPLRELSSSSLGLQAHMNVEQKDEAIALTRPLREAAEETTRLVSERFRAVPDKVSLPMMEVRITIGQRVRALRQVLESYDSLVREWYDFVFVDPPLGGRSTQLEDMQSELGIQSETAVCEFHQRRCEELTNSSAISWDRARSTLASLRDAISAWESVVYHAVVADRS